MANLKQKISIYLENNSKNYIDERNNIVLQNDNDGNGDYIKEWNVSGVAKPTDAQLNAITDDADKYARNQIVINKRKDLYGSWEKQLEEINEQGMDSWKARIAQIKTDNPKESE